MCQNQASNERWIQDRVLTVVDAPAHRVYPQRQREAVRANQARVRALEGMEVLPAIDKGGARRGYRASFAIDETPFQGLGDVALFVRLLQKALDTQTTVNRFYQCEAKCRKGGARIRWPKEAKP